MPAGEERDQFARIPSRADDVEKRVQVGERELAIHAGPAGRAFDLEDGRVGTAVAGARRAGVEQQRLNTPREVRDGGGRRFDGRRRRRAGENNAPRGAMAGTEAKHAGPLAWGRTVAQDHHEHALVVCLRRPSTGATRKSIEGVAVRFKPDHPETTLCRPHRRLDPGG